MIRITIITALIAISALTSSFSVPLEACCPEGKAEASTEIKVAKKKADRVAMVKLSGISCQSCLETIKESLLELKGVKAVETLLEKASVRVYVKGDVKDAAIKKTIKDCGKYQVKSISWKKVKA